MVKKYNFDEVVDRANTYSAKLDELEMKFGRADLIPMWIADMDFRTAPELIASMKSRVEEGIWGYTSRPDAYFESVRDWQIYKNSWSPEPKYMSHALGVLPMLANLCASIMEEGKSKVIIQTPVFSEFKTVLDNWNMEIIYNPLKRVGTNYEMDFEDLEVKAKEADFIIFCNPHNPIGKVWSKEDVKRMAEICVKNNVTIISDEMYSDIMLWGNKHTPTASISEEVRKNTITCYSLGKTFNLAGVQVATCVFPNMELKEKYDKILAKFETKRNNAFSIVANQVAMNECKDWFNAVIEYIEGNIEFTMDYITNNIPRIKFTKPEGTYLLWLDCSDLGLAHEEVVSFMINDAKLALNDGMTFGEEGRYHMRMNLASPRVVVEQALKQLEEAVNRLEK